MTLEDFLDKFKESFSDYVEHVVLSWYLRNAKMEAFKLETMPGHMMSFVADFAQNIKVIKRSETAEEYFHRPEVAIHGIVSGFKSADGGRQYQMTHTTSSDYRFKIRNIFTYFHSTLNTGRKIASLFTAVSRRLLLRHWKKQQS